MEQGAAELTLELDNGWITAHNGRGTLMFSGLGRGDSWERIVAAIVASCDKVDGPMAVAEERRIYRERRASQTKEEDPRRTP